MITEELRWFELKPKVVIGKPTLESNVLHSVGNKMICGVGSYCLLPNYSGTLSNLTTRTAAHSLYRINTLAICISKGS